MSLKSDLRPERSTFMLRVLTSLFLVLILIVPAHAETLAKQLFGAVDAGSSQRAASFGGYAKGCLAGSEQLAEIGPTWQAMRLGRNRNWAHPATVKFVERLSAKAAMQRGWKGLYIGDMSQPRGGPMLTGHASHQTGLDVDIWMLPPKRLTLSRREREGLSSISTRRDLGAFMNGNWSRAHHNILKAAARDRAVARIFVFPGAKVQMCKDAKGNRNWLRKIRPWSGHHFHFHVRLLCPDNAPGCVNQAPPPPGDGCAAAEKWVAAILDPQAPDPTPRTPRPELFLADLPPQCASVMQAR